MADYTFDQFPIEADEIDIEAMQEEITALQQKLNTLTARTINGLDLTEDRVLKSAQFAESVTGEKMLANLLYSQVSSWDSGAKKSIKLASDTFLAAAGVDGVKAVLTSGDLNDYYGVHNAGVYYLRAGASAFQNAPTGYSILLCYAGDNSFCGQMIFHQGRIWCRERTGNPAAWTNWFLFTGTDTGS